jgi:undecaprenyl-diphosphatase
MPARATPYIVLGGIGLVVLLAVAVSSGITDPVDHPIIRAIRADALHDTLAPLRFVTELGSTWAVAVVAGIVLLVGLTIGPWRHGVIGAITILLASTANSLFKLGIARERPDLLDPLVIEHGFSFPSGHSTLGMVSYGVLAVLVSRSRLPRGVRIGIVAALGVLVFLIGLSRVWLGVHYPTDVVAGWTTGAVIVLVYAAVTRSVSREPSEAAVDVDPAAPRSDRPAPG